MKTSKGRYLIKRVYREGTILFKVYDTTKFLWRLRGKLVASEYRYDGEVNEKGALLTYKEKYELNNIKKECLDRITKDI
jgi:hypothetical protein